MNHNEIFIHTDRGEYIPGDTVYGTIFLYISKPIATKELFFAIKGEEKLWWIERQSYTDSDGNRQTRELNYDASHTFFHDEVPIISYPGGFPMGQFSYPFCYTLPRDLPGVFKDSHHDWKAKVSYKVKAVVDVKGGKDLKTKQHFVVHEKLDHSIQPQHYGKKKIYRDSKDAIGLLYETKTVRTCCCFPRGPVHCEAWVDKNAYMAGETAQVHVNVNNASAVKVSHFNTKLIRMLHLKDNHGHKKVIKDIITQQKYDGTEAHTDKQSDIPLPLIANREAIQPSTSSKYITCEYKVMIELDIPFAPDLEIFCPTTVYAPQYASFGNWVAPNWANDAVLVNEGIDPRFAVDQAILEAQFKGGYLHSPEGFAQNNASAPIEDPIPQYSENIISNIEPSVKSPLL